MIEVIKEINKNCRIRRAGFLYPIRFLNQQKYLKSVTKLRSVPVFGEPARPYYFTTLGGGFRICNQYAHYCADKNFLWYAGPTQWSGRNRSDNWIVFKTQKHRSMALMILQ